MKLFKKKTSPTRCAHCGGPFGLIRHQKPGKHFCSQICKHEHQDTGTIFPVPSIKLRSLLSFGKTIGAHVWR